MALWYPFSSRFPVCQLKSGLNCFVVVCSISPHLGSWRSNIFLHFTGGSATRSHLISILHLRNLNLWGQNTTVLRRLVFVVYAGPDPESSSGNSPGFAAQNKQNLKRHEKRGLIPRILDYIFQRMSSEKTQVRLAVLASSRHLPFIS